MSAETTANTKDNSDGQPKGSVGSIRIWFNRIGKTDRQFVEFSESIIRIGSADGSQLPLRSQYVDAQACMLTHERDVWELIATGSQGLQIGNQMVRPGERTVIIQNTQLEIYPFSLTLEVDGFHHQDQMTQGRLSEELTKIIVRVHRSLLEHLELADVGQERKSDVNFLTQFENDIESIAEENGLFNENSAPVLDYAAALACQSFIISRILESTSSRKAINTELWKRMHTTVSDFENSLQRLAVGLEAQLKLDESEDVSRKMELVDARYWQAWQNLNEQSWKELSRYLGTRHLKKQIKDIVFGYGPLEDLLMMPHISEIMVVSRDKIYIEKNGVLEKSGRQFVSDDVTISIIDRIVAKVGRRIDKSQPLVDARLLDGSRVNAVIPPIAISGPALTIRKFPEQKLSIEDLIRYGSITPSVAEFLRCSVMVHKNIIVAGGTGSGKTSMLNCLSDFIPDKERIVTIEDTAELRLHSEHVVSMETKPPNVEGAGEYTIRDLVKNSLRMRPDRIVVGECRGPEALDMLQAMNTGHDGSMTTIHANTPADVLLRLEVLVQMAADLPSQSVQRQIASAVDLVIQLTRGQGGRRYVSHVTEFVEYDERNEKIKTKDLFLFRGSESKGGRIEPTGALPSYMDVLLDNNLIDLDMFYR